MSDLIAIAYPDRDTAETVRETLADLAAQRIIELEDAVVLTRDQDGAVNPSSTTGSAALILLVRRVTTDKVLPHVQCYGGEVIQTSLDEETDARLREALGPAPVAG